MNLSPVYLAMLCAGGSGVMRFATPWKLHSLLLVPWLPPQFHTALAP